MAEEPARACILGAGCSRFTTAGRLQDHGIPYDRVAASDETAEDEAYGLGHCYASRWHTTQVNLAKHLANLNTEKARGAKRARTAGHALPLPAHVPART